MPITHLTSTAVFQSGTGNRTVTPNASTAVGDVMVLPVGFQDSSATTITTPTGWTLQKSAVLTGTLKTSLFTRTRQSGDSTWTYAPNQSVETSHLALSVNGGDPASLIVGADGTRAASGGTTATTAPSITTTVPNTRVYVISTERTTANETVEATVNNGFTKLLHTYANGTSAESIFIGFKDVATPGAVGATTVTFQNSQASNGYAVLVAIAPSAASQSIAGTAAAVSTSSAAFTTQQSIAGTAPAISTSDASVTASRPIAGAVVAVSSVTASFAVALSVSGSSDALSTASGALTSRQGFQGDVSGHSEASGTLSAALSVLGVSQAFSTVAGDFTVAHAPASIQGVVAAVTTITATLSASLEISATVSAITVTTADFTVGEAIPLPPVPKERTLTGHWSTTLTGSTITRTLADMRVQHTLEEA